MPTDSGVPSCRVRRCSDVYGSGSSRTSVPSWTKDHRSLSCDEGDLDGVTGRIPFRSGLTRLGVEVSLLEKDGRSSFRGG